jgi:hypothetical protein
LGLVYQSCPDKDLTDGQLGNATVQLFQETSVSKTILMKKRIKIPLRWFGVWGWNALVSVNR